jgi:hypothetical protein
MKTSANILKVGDLVVMVGAIAGPAMRSTGLSYVNQDSCNGATALLESLRRHDKDETQPAWTAQFLVSGLRVLPTGHPATVSPFYDFGGHKQPTE